MVERDKKFWVAQGKPLPTITLPLWSLQSSSLSLDLRALLWSLVNFFLIRDQWKFSFFSSSQREIPNSPLPSNATITLHSRCRHDHLSLRWYHIPRSLLYWVSWSLCLLIALVGGMGFLWVVVLIWMVEWSRVYCVWAWVFIVGVMNSGLKFLWDW